MSFSPRADEDRDGVDSDDPVERKGRNQKWAAMLTGYIQIELTVFS